MEFQEYQLEAAKTSTLRLEGPQGAIAPMLGLASETGSILNSYKKYLRDGIDFNANLDHLREEIGDLLWYASAIATACGLELESIAQENLRRTADRYRPSGNSNTFDGIPVFDALFPNSERFPRRLVVEFSDFVTSGGQRCAKMALVEAQPNEFPLGRLSRGGGKFAGYTVGSQLGDPLTDNTKHPDSYRYHDAIHFGFMTVLGWSPNTRSLMGIKRKSDPQVDENEDGARAIFAEEGLTTILSRLAVKRTMFLTEASIDNEVIELAKAATSDLEVDVLPGWLWRRAIVQGFTAMARLADNRGGYLTADLDARHLTFSKLH